MNFNLSAKIGGGFSLMGVLLVVCGLAGYQSAGSLSRSLDFVTGPARQADDGAKEAKIGIQSQLIAVDRIAFLAAEGERGGLDALEQATKGAVDRILSSGLVPAEELRALQRQLGEFTGDGRALLAANAAYRQGREALTQGVEEFQDFLIAVEELAGRKMVDSAVDLDSTETKDVSRSEEWFATNAAGEARLALLTRLYRFQQFLDAPGDRENLAQLEQALADLTLATEQIAGVALFSAPVEKGPFVGTSYKEALAKLLTAHRDRFATTMERFRALRAAQERYVAAADTLGTTVRRVEAVANQRVESELKEVAAQQAAAANAILASVLLGLLMT